MSQREIELLEVLRMMRVLTQNPTEKDAAIACLVKCITSLSKDTKYEEVSLKIISSYANTFEPGIVT